MAKERKTIHVISNSHWDREWGYPFEETRLLLLDFMDGLLDLLDKRPDFHSFTMDSQTLCVEDYLEYRPEKRETVMKHVKSGRLIVGPWYSLPEEYLVNAESLVRNLVVGHRSAEALGKVCKIGYTPFGYGQTSQMPQIYHGFDIDTIIFYRGINSPKSEYIMEGADGSRLLGMRFGCMSRFSYYIYIYRVLRYGSDDVFQRYDWDRGAAPFRLASDDNPRGHYYVLDAEGSKKWNAEPIAEQLQKLVRDESEHFTTSHICSMQGFDTSNPDAKEMEIMEMCQKLLPEHDIKFSSLEEYMNAMRKEVKNPLVVKGESRNPSSSGKWTHLFGDVISARVRLRRANHRSEVNLQRLAEPWSAIGSMVGGAYERHALKRAWRLLLKNHPHDTITGAGVDQMEKDSLYRFDQIDIISEGLSRRGMGDVQINVDNSDLGPKDSAITVFNSSPFPRKGVVSAFIDMPQGMGYDAFSIQTPKGKKQRFQIKEQFPQGVLVRNLQDISIEQRVKRALCHVELTDAVPAFGYKTLHMVREERFEHVPGTMMPEARVMENEHLRVEFNSDGTLNMTHKESKAVYTGLHYVEDTGETGHSWIHMEPEKNETITSHGFPCAISVVECGPLLARVKVEYFMQIPVSVNEVPGIDFREGELNNTTRTKDRKEIVVTSVFTLRAGAKRLEVATSLDNQCRHHRMRVVFPTRLKCNRTDSEASFDVISRDITVKKDNAYYGRSNPQYPMHRFVDMSDGKKGFAIVNSSGMREYEAMDTAERPLAITLFRAFTYRNSPVFGRWETYPDMDLAQCIGKHEWTYAIYPHTGDWTNGCYDQSEDLNLPLKPAQVGPHKGKLPKELSFLQLEGDNLQMTTLKLSEDRDNTYVVRIFNPTDKAVQGKLNLFKPVKKAWLTNMNEERREALKPEGKTIPLKLGKKKIITLEFQV